jgi:hypothetical protein
MDRRVKPGDDGEKVDRWQQPGPAQPLFHDMRRKHRDVRRLSLFS